MIPVKTTIYALQSSLDRAIDQYKINLQNNIKLKNDDKKKWDAFKELERGKVQIIAQLQQGLDKYRSTVKKMSTDEREDEKHDSSRLGDHMRAVGLPKPGFYYHAHAIISGSDTRSWRLRTILADCEMGIDDPHNGSGYLQALVTVVSVHTLKQFHIAEYTEKTIILGYNFVFLG